MPSRFPGNVIFIDFCLFLEDPWPLRIVYTSVPCPDNVAIPIKRIPIGKNYVTEHYKRKTSIPYVGIWGRMTQRESIC